MPVEMRDDLDAEAERRDANTAGDVNRSDVAVDWLELGQEAAKILDEEGVTGSQARRATVRQALLDHFREFDD